MSRLALTDMDLSRSLGDMRKQAAELCRTGDWEAALVLHEVLRQENPDSFASALPHARLLREIGRSRQAIERLEPVAARDPDPQRSLSLIAAWRKELNIHSGQDLAAVTPENPTSGPLPGQAASVPPPNRQGTLVREGRLDEVVALRAEHMLANPGRVKARLVWIEGLIMAGRFEEAERAVTDLSGILDLHPEAAVQRAWREARHDRYDAARRIVRTALDERGHRALHWPVSRIDWLKTARHPSSSNLALFTTVHNEKLRLPWFLRYYRELGIRHFVIVDNDSTDGSREWLMDQGDVSLYWTPDDFRSAMCGMRWINLLAERHVPGGWCLYVDADEQLVYPDVEHRGLPDLVAWLEAQGHEAMRAHMIDMAASPLADGALLAPGQDPVERCPYFEPHYRFIPKSGAPYERVTGGLRDVLGESRAMQALPMVKTPLVRIPSGVRFLSSSHDILPARVADVTGGLLHFKLAGDYFERYFTKSRHAARRDQATRAQRIKESMQAEGGLSLPASTLRYRDSAQLVALGILRPGGWAG